MKAKFRKGMQAILLVVFLVSTALLAGKWIDKANGSDTYEEALAIASGDAGTHSQIAEPPVPAAPRPDMQWVPAPVEQDSHMEDLMQIDLDALRQVNPDVIGWILIPDTEINYPLLQGEDNDFYLNHTWKGQKNSVGSVFLEYQNSADMMDYNTIVYGHNMRDGSMFADIRNYAVKDYWKTNPFIYIVTDAGVYRYDVFSAYKADLEGLTFGVEFPKEESKDNFLRYIRRESDFNAGIVPEPNDRILTLSTCYGNTNESRWVVHARLRMVEVEAQ